MVFKIFSERFGHEAVIQTRVIGSAPEI